MQNTISNPCIRCGKQRIDSETWTENVGNAKIVRVTTVCPDKECQAEVDKDIAMKKKLRDDAATKRSQDKEERIKSMALKTS